MRITPALGAGAVLLVTVMTATNLQAEDTLKKWQFGVGFSYWSTDDDIRSNSATAYAPVDPSQGTNLPPVRFSDPRPDANELNEATIQDDFKLDFLASYGLTRWVTLQLDASYFKGDVGDVEFYSEDVTVPVGLSQLPPNNDPNSGQPDNPEIPGFQSVCAPTDGSTPPIGAKPCYGFSLGSQNLVKRNAFLPVGQITEIPVSLSGVVRFRPESPFDPYVGAGVGYMFTSLDTSVSSIGTPIVISASDVTGTNQIVSMKGFKDVTDFTNGLVVRSIQTGARAILAYPCRQVSITPPICDSNTGRVVAADGGTPIAGLSANVEGGPEYHLMGGVDYYFTSRWSMYVDARYVWASSKVEVRIDGETQVLSGINDYGCQSGAVRCRTTSGDIDLSDAVLLQPTSDDTIDTILIQGGDIRLGGFSIGVGAKATF